MTAKTATSAKISDAKYNAAVKSARTALRSASNANWKLGDLASEVSAVYGDQTIQRFAGDLDVAYKTLLNYRTIATAYAPSERSENSFTVHEILAPLDDHVALVSAKIWTTREARELVKSRKSDTGTGTDDESGTDTDVAPADELAVAEAEVKRLQGELARAEAKVAKLRAAQGTPATDDAKPAPAAAAVHSIRGIPSHTADDNRADCPKCKLAAKPAAKPAAKASTRRPNRTTRAAAKPAAKVA
jgi:hypothetical protein